MRRATEDDEARRRLPIAAAPASTSKNESVASSPWPNAHPPLLPVPPAALHVLLVASQVFPGAHWLESTHDGAHTPSLLQRYAPHGVVTPSAPVDDSPSSEHLAVMRVHLPLEASHLNPGKQSSLVAHEPRHAVPSPVHANPSQRVVIASGQCPLPSHVEGAV